MNNVKMFCEEVNKDADLQRKLKAVQGKTQEEVLEAVVAIAKENGFEITKEGFQKYMEAAQKAAAENAELNEDELDAVAGGGVGEWIAFSVASIGILCAASAVGKIFDTCGLDHPETLSGDRY